jgi:hypothetical protein
LVKEVWRGWVRTTRLGRQGGASNICSEHTDILLLSWILTIPTDHMWKHEWPMLIFLSEVDTQALVITMGDKEIFTTLTSPCRAKSANTR